MKYIKKNLWTILLYVVLTSSVYGALILFGMQYVPDTHGNGCVDLMCSTEALMADVATLPYSFPSHATAYGSEVLANDQALRNVINGKIDSYNIENGTIIDADVHTSGMTTYGKVKESSIEGAIYWDVVTNRNGSADNADALHTHALSALTGSLGASGHGDLSGDTSTMHTAESVVVVDTGGFYATDEVESALQETGTELASQSAAISSLGAAISSLETRVSDIESGSGGGTTGFGTSTAWGIMMDQNASNFTTPAQFSGVVDARTLTPSIAGSMFLNPFIYSDTAINVCAGMQFTAINTGSLIMQIGRGPAGETSYFYLNNAIAFEVSYDANGNPSSSVDHAPHSSALVGTLFMNLTFVIGTTGVKTMEIVNLDDGAGWTIMSILNNWLYNPIVSTYSPYIRY